MSENITFEHGENFKEAVCINTGRVYDSCCDRDCLQDLRCYFTAAGRSVISDTVNVRIKSAEVLNVYADVEQINFNKGFYSCDLTFFFLITLEAFTSSHSCPVEVKGLSTFSKKVILFGSEGNVKVFSNPDSLDNCNCGAMKESSNSPRCIVQAVDPIPLSAKIGKICDCCCNIRTVPSFICDKLGGDIITENSQDSTGVFITIGLFTVIQLVRDVQMLIPVYDFCIPEKHCTDAADEPCDVFRRIAFPTDDFFPPKSISENNCGCK